MPALPTDVALYIKRVRDTLRTGPGFTAASLMIGSATSRVYVVAKEPGYLGNNITVTITLPTVTANLDVTLSGTAINIALAQTSGTPDTAENTSTLIAAAINAAAPNLVVAYVPPTAGAGSIAAAVAVASLSGGAGGENGVATNPLNFLRAQDTAAVLELLSDALDQPGTLTATSGSATTLGDGAATFVPGQQVGNYVKFKDDTTTTLIQGESYRILANTDRLLTFETAADTIVNGDTYEIVCGILDEDIAALRQGKLLSDATPNIYGDYQIVQDALTRVTNTFGITQATGTLTFTGQPTDAQALTINGKVYTFKDTVGSADGNVHISHTDASGTLDNLIAAINLGAGSGTAYGASMTLHPTVRAAVGAGDTMVITAKTLSGAAGNAITTPVTTVTGGTWAAATLTGGVSGIALRTNTVATLTGLATGSTTTEVAVNTTNTGKMRVDEFKNLSATISGEVRTVVGNSETTILLSKALTSAPGAVSVVLSRNVTVDVSPSAVHPGGQPGHNMRLADHIAQAEAAVVAYTLPT